MLLRFGGIPLGVQHDRRAVQCSRQFVTVAHGPGQRRSLPVVAKCLRVASVRVQRDAEEVMRPELAYPVADVEMDI